MKTNCVVRGIIVFFSFYGFVLGAYNASVDKSFTGTNGTSVNGVKMYSSVAAALSGVALANSSAYSIFIKNGRYTEHITIDKPYLTLVGQNRDSTILSFNLAQGSANGSSTWGADCATLKITASNFTAVNMTIENSFDYLGNMVKDTNSATYIKSAQALAVRTASGSNKAFFRNCIISGYQDPLFAELGIQYYKKCVIMGAVDFIYGGGQAAFDSCDIICRNRPGKNPMGYVTAPSTQSTQNYGLVFFNCNLKKEIATIPAKSYGLGRPWHPSASNGAADPAAVGMSVYISCWMDDMIKPVGWDSMSGKDISGSKIWFVPYKTSDSRFYEYKSTGPGSILAENAPYRKFLTDAEAANYTVSKVLGGWTPDESAFTATKAALVAAVAPRIQLEYKHGIFYLKTTSTNKIVFVSVFSVDGKRIWSSPDLQYTLAENAAKFEFTSPFTHPGKAVYLVTCRFSHSQFTSPVFILE